MTYRRWGKGGGRCGGLNVFGKMTADPWLNLEETTVLVIVAWEYSLYSHVNTLSLWKEVKALPPN
jgi:hypothetical protein